jgi:hypothetical protein
MRYFFRWEWLTSNAHMFWPKLQWLGAGRKYAAQAQALLGAQKPAAATSATPKISSLPVIDTPRELRKDQAHCHTSTDKVAEPAPKKKSA